MRGRRRALPVWVGVLALTAGSLLAPEASEAQAAGDPAAAAAAHLQAGEWSRAVTVLRGIVEADPDDGLAWLRLGRGLIELGRETEALQALGAAEGTGFQSPFIGVFRARALVRLDREGEALTALEAIPPSPALGGGTALDTIADFAALADRARFTAVVAGMERAAWPCRDDGVSREFDFWIGTWDVYVQGGQAGVNVVEPMMGGCALLENWTNVRGREGKSFNWVDRATFRTSRWRQMWVDDSGNTLDYYDGHYADGAMRFTGHTFSAAGDSIPQKLIFYDVHPDTVRQVFEQSNDGGETWVVTFDGTYVRRR